MKPIANLMPAMYSHRLHDIQKAARSCGYAIAVHGSMQTDFDLVAIPWVDDAKTPDILVKTICQRVGLRESGKPGEKPHGRTAYTLMMGGCLFVDLSVVPRAR